MPVHRWCSACAAESAFDAFDCPDHAGDCLELVCRSCGTGVELAGHAAGGARQAPAAAAVVGTAA